MDINNNDVSVRILLIMNELGLNQIQLAQQLQITQPAISKYLQGRIPPPSVLLRLANLCGRTIEWFLTGKIEIMYDYSAVREKEQRYSTNTALTEKLNLLPENIKNNLENLIDLILMNLKKDKTTLRVD
jgi:transcriptional regulator with XRE-family HTH domain